MKFRSTRFFKGLLLAVASLTVCAIMLACTAGRPQTAAEQEELQTTAEQEELQSEATDSLSVLSSEPTGPLMPLSRSGYQLEQVVVLSRHNLRSPFGVPDVTPHTWYKWTSKPGELSPHGEMLEKEMGQYFHKWLEEEGLFRNDEHIESSEVRIYANSVQRTIATAEFFTSSLFPETAIEVETHMDKNQDDPVFAPRLTFVSPQYKTDAENQVREMFQEKINSLEDNYALLSDVLDIEQSKAWKNGAISSFRTDDTTLVLKNNSEPKIKGSLLTAALISDPLILQYYEEPDDGKAAFGHELTDAQWKEIGEIRSVYGDVLYSAPLIAANVAHPLLQEIAAELTTEGRKFSFLCGHDTSISSVLAAIGVEEYDLPDAVEGKTPIGGKLVFCRWTGQDQRAWCTVDFVYQTTDQLRGISSLLQDEHPGIVPMHFSGLITNEDGLYSEQDFMDLLENSIGAYDELNRKYSDTNS